MKKVSVAIATYNGARYLEVQLNSIYSQTVLPFEVIAVDDCSTDKTVSILENFATTNGLKYVVNSTNLGVNHTFAKALELCSGDVFMFCDQDDYWLPEKIENSLRAIQSLPFDEPNLATSSVSDADAILRIVFLKNIVSTPKEYSDFIPDMFMQGSTQVLNRKLKELLTFPENGIYDLYIATTALVIGNRKWIGEPQMLYRHHNDNVCAKWNSHKLYYILKKAFFGRLFQYRITNEYIRNYLMPVFQTHKKDIPEERKEFIIGVIRIEKSILNVFAIREWPIKKKMLVLLVRVIDNIKNALIFCVKYWGRKK